MRELDKFLETEITYQEMYNEIMSFILSFHVRCGECECNEFVVKKIDQTNFIIFREYETGGQKEINGAFSIYRNKLISAINDKARAVGLTIITE